MSTTRGKTDTSQAAIFSRLWGRHAAELTPAVARHVLTLGFGEADKARIRELTRRNGSGLLTETERDELDNYVKVGDLLAILQSKARRLLKRSPFAGREYG